MAKKKSSKPADIKDAPAPVSASLPALGAPLPPEIFPDPASLPRPSISLPAAPQQPPLSGLVPLAVARQHRSTSSPRSIAAAHASAEARKHNPTFDAPTPEIAQARALATNLRAILGQAMQSLTHAVREIQQVQIYLAAHPEAVAEFERLDISTSEAERFRCEALDVIDAFKPMEGS